MSLNSNLSFGETVRQQRWRLGLSQRAIAEAVAVSRSTIKEIERDAFRPGPDLTARLADLFNLIGPARLTFVAQACTALPPAPRPGTLGRPRSLPLLADATVPARGSSPHQQPPSGPYRILGAFLQQQRRDLGLSQQALAAALQATRSMIREIEDGRIQPNSPLARRLANFLALAVAAPTDGVRFGEQIRQLRLARRLTQGALAAALQTSRSMIKEIERGATRPSVILAARLADFFGFVGVPRERFLLSARVPLTYSFLRT